MDDEITARLKQIEAHVAHLERQVEQMDAVIIEQGRSLEQLKRQTQRQATAMETLELERANANNPKPPHH